MGTSDSLIAERYKYILAQKQALNDKTFKIASFYQAFTIIIASGQFEIVRSFRKGEIDATFSVTSSWCLLSISVLVSIISLAMMIGGICAWRSYGIEEENLLSSSPSQLKKPSLLYRSLSWYETYIILAILLTVGAHFTALYSVVLPAFR